MSIEGVQCSRVNFSSDLNLNHNHDVASIGYAETVVLGFASDFWVFENSDTPWVAIETGTRVPVPRTTSYFCLSCVHLHITFCVFSCVSADVVNRRVHFINLLYVSLPTSTTLYFSPSYHSDFNDCLRISFVFFAQRLYLRAQTYWWTLSTWQKSHPDCLHYWILVLDHRRNILIMISASYLPMVTKFVS